MIRRAARQIGDGLDPEIDIEMLTPAAPVTQITLGQKVKTARHPVAVRRRSGARVAQGESFYKLGLRPNTFAVAEAVSYTHLTLPTK